MEVWQILLWSILTVVLVIAEIATVQLVSVWLAAGSLAAFIISLFSDNILLQVIAFIVVSVILLVATRPFVKKFLGNKTATNVDAIIGEECIVTEQINNINGGGRVQVNGISWAAKNARDDSAIPVDARCKVKEVKGVTLFIEQV